MYDGTKSPAIRIPQGRLGITCRYMRDPGMDGYACTYPRLFCVSRNEKWHGKFCMRSPALENLATTIVIPEELALLAEVVHGKGVFQNKWHPHDVYGHTLEVVRILKEMGADKTLIVAGYLHDIGKPVVMKPETNGDGRGVFSPEGRQYHDFPNHESVGERMVREMDPELFARLGVSRETVALIVGAHYLPMSYVKMMKREPERFAEIVEELDLRLATLAIGRKHVLDIFYADKASTGSNATDGEFLLALRNYLNGQAGFEKLKVEFEKMEKR